MNPPDKMKPKKYLQLICNQHCYAKKRKVYHLL
jgi:hypothetical protein